MAETAFRAGILYYAKCRCAWTGQLRITEKEADTDRDQHNNTCIQ